MWDSISLVSLGSWVGDSKLERKGSNYKISKIKLLEFAQQN